MTNKKCLLKSFAFCPYKTLLKTVFFIFYEECINLLFLLSHYLSPSEEIFFVEFKVVARLLTLPLYFNEYATRNFLYILRNYSYARIFGLMNFCPGISDRIVHATSQKISGSKYICSTLLRRRIKEPLAYQS